MEPVVAAAVGRAMERNFVEFIDFVPTLITAAVIVYLGFFLGGKIQPKVSRAGRRVELDEKVRKTPFEAFFSDGEESVSNTFAVLVKYYVGLVGILAAIEWIVIQTGRTSPWLLSSWAHDVLGYVPPIAMGLVALFVGFYVATYAAEQVRESPAAKQTGFAPLLAGATKTLLYFVVLVVGLDTMGFQVGVLHTFAAAFAYGVGLAAALAIGIAFGWGGKEYVAENIDDWVENSKEITEEAKAAPSDD
ncbi:mechanosensitive ion channel family protein [Halopiger djelfimassiliensis]|uniref:mechanosensitive ion channel family protein n=1 Tax=Halopiger djelfimassiliensis TaxID=1293047 RepID=UPI00067805C7|nr:hypothetical protein [Halopiger djelfimassiliensis]